jgi:hypothetical protein
MLAALVSSLSFSFHARAAVLVEVAHREVEHLERGLFGRELAAVTGHPPQPRVDRLDQIRRSDPPLRCRATPSPRRFTHHARVLAAAGPPKYQWPEDSPLNSAGRCAGQLLRSTFVY